MAAPEQCAPDDPRLPGVLALIRRSFSFMDGRIDPPSSMHNLTLKDIAHQCRIGEVWVIGTAPDACVFLRPKGQHLYFGKLAVDSTARGCGLARDLVDLATDRARTLGLAGLELDVRIELAENHATFAKMGFVALCHGHHKGFARATFVTMRKTLTAPLR